LIGVPVGAGVLIAALRYLPVDSQRTERRLDRPGIATLSATMLLLVVLLAAGGLGLGIQFSGLIAHLTSAVPTEYAADISGVSSTTVTDPTTRATQYIRRDRPQAKPGVDSDLNSRRSVATRIQ
jgi:hypothetical protein